MDYTGGMYLFFALALALLASTPPDEHRGLGVSRYKGCPGNALCSQEAGGLRRKWKQLLSGSRKDPGRVRRLEAFRRRHGIPLGVWVPKKREGKEGKVTGVHFDSPCKNFPWMESEVFVPGLTGLSGVVLRRGYLLGKKGISTRTLPRGDVPLYEKKNRLYYNLHFEGEYYGISMGAGGDVRMEEKVAPLRPYEFPRQIPCPQKLLDHFAKKHPPSRPDYRPLCLDLPGASGKPVTLLVGTDCV